VRPNYKQNNKLPLFSDSFSPKIILWSAHLFTAHNYFERKRLLDPITRLRECDFIVSALQGRTSWCTPKRGQSLVILRDFISFALQGRDIVMNPEFRIPTF
jgi:hypothetical protein